MSSLNSLRWKIGTLFERNRWSIGVFGAIFNEAGEILLVRGKGQKWSLPGGGVTQKDAKDAPVEDEVFILALFRELREEIGLPSKAFLRLSGPGIFVSCRLQDVAFVYVLSVEEEVIRKLSPKREIAELKFFSQETLPELLGPRMQRMVQWAFERHALG